MGNGAGVQERYSESERSESPQKSQNAQNDAPRAHSNATTAPQSVEEIIPRQSSQSHVTKQVTAEKPPENNMKTEIQQSLPTSTSSDQLNRKASEQSNVSAEAKYLAMEAENKKSAKSEGKPKENKRDYQPPPADEDSASDADLEPVEVLLQFIPYYGQGDPSNDSIVRSTLSGLSVEDIDSKDEYGNTLLLLACQYRCEDLVRIMLNKGADPNAVNTSGACCLHFACYRESASFPVAKVLLQNGANPDVAESTFGCTPLHYCAGTGDIEFCKLLLGYGAQINAYDYYNYTCVDYAREAGMADVASFLLVKLDKANAQAKVRTGSTQMPPSPSGKSAASTGLFAANMDLSAWEVHVDPDSNGKYYIHLRTGECLWEAELKQRITQFQQQQQLQADAKTPVKTASRDTGDTKGEAKSQVNEAWLVTQAAQSRLIGFLSKYDAPRLVEIEQMVETYRGREQELLRELCAKYNAPEAEQFAAFQKKLDDLRAGAKLAPISANSSSVPASSSSGGGGTQVVNDVNLVDPLLLQELSNETRRKLEAQFEEDSKQFKRRFDATLENEKAAFRQSIGEKEGVIAKLTAEIESVARVKDSLEDEMKTLSKKLERLQLSGGEAVSQVESDLTAARAENKDLKAQLSALQQEYSIALEKMRSLETTLSNLTSGNEEMIAREKAASEERAAVQREREVKHAVELQQLEERSKGVELRLKTDFNAQRSEWTRTEKEMKETHDTLKRAKDKEIDGLRRDLTEKKAQFAQEISSANIQIDDYRKASEAATKRAEEAEYFQKIIQDELAEAKVVQKYNAQLHKDLQREQLARKKLHNDMEDLKGKIRVYVRIRPFSNSERERGSTESVTRDGKMTVLLRGLNGKPDDKKFYDFDQVFGGSPTEGNSQADVFKDTKHLIMSVVDGYNVCIFAYGQTGAGKSFTMIGAADIGNCMSENGDFDELAGITPRAVSELFRLLNERSAQLDYVVEVQMFQLYRDGLDDLLKEKKKKKKGDDEEDRDKKDPPLKITLAEHSPTGLVQVEGGESIPATTPGEVMKIFAKGSARRATASTQMNAESSRSHLICSLTVKLTNKRSGNQSVGKLTLVDLAGSERVDKSGAAGEVLKEAQSINKSLSALGDVIAALTTGQQHVPYRNHPLTMLMSDSIGGNAKTLMFVNTSPADYNNAESNSSLAFASRCKDITNSVAAGPGVQAAQVSALKKELAKMKKSGAAPGGGPKMPPGGATLARPDTAAGGGGRAPPGGK